MRKRGELTGLIHVRVTPGMLEFLLSRPEGIGEYVRGLLDRELLGAKVGSDSVVRVRDPRLGEGRRAVVSSFDPDELEDF